MMSDLVLLQDAPGARGERLGTYQKALLKRRITEFKALCEEQRCGPLELPERARQVSTTLTSISQEWLIEARAIASAAQVPAAQFMAITWPPEKVQPRMLPKRANDSAAFAAQIRTQSSAKAVLVENCDGPDIIHYVVSRAASPGSLPYVAMAEAGDLGIKVFVNEAGLAGTFHVGPQIDDYTRAAIQPSLILRWICERATSCAQAVQEFTALQQRYGAATPDKRGVCYLFADGNGDTLLLESSGNGFQQKQSSGFVTLANKFQLKQGASTSTSSMEPFRQRYTREYLSSTQLNVRLAFELARNDRRVGSEKGVCDGDTRASFVAVLAEHGARSYALVTLGSPLFNIATPVFPGVGIPHELVDGSAYLASWRTPEPTGTRNARRTTYEEALWKLMGYIPPSGNEEKLRAMTSELWKEREAIVAAAVPQQAEQKAEQK